MSGSSSATTVIRAYGVLAGILDIAVKDRRLPINPARGVRLPRKVRKRRAYLTHAQVQLVAIAAALDHAKAAAPVANPLPKHVAPTKRPRENPGN